MVIGSTIPIYKPLQAISGKSATSFLPALAKNHTKIQQPVSASGNFDEFNGMKIQVPPIPPRISHLSHPHIASQ
jgi:hypothetical protein